MFKKLAQKLNTERKREAAVGAVINPIDINFDDRRQAFLNKLSESAVKLYEKEQDVKKFTSLAMSNAEDNSADTLVKELFDNGIVDPLDDKKLTELSFNERFLKELGYKDK
jgi:hypothetical protein